jgi:hypothetical protein
LVTTQANLRKLSKTAQNEENKVKKVAIEPIIRWGPWDLICLAEFLGFGKYATQHPDHRGNSNLQTGTARVTDESPAEKLIGLARLTH